jgi:hypothetical protein
MGILNMILYLETDNSSFQPITPFRSNAAPKCNPKSRKRGSRTTRPRSQSRPCAQLSNGYPNMILYLETNNSTFQSIIPLRSNPESECEPKSRKRGPRTTCPRSQSRPCAQLVSKYNYVFGNREFFFSTHNPTPFKPGPRM